MVGSTRVEESLFGSSLVSMAKKENQESLLVGGLKNGVVEEFMNFMVGVGDDGDDDEVVVGGES